MNRQGRVAFLRFLPVTLKGLIPKPCHENPQTIGQHVKKHRLLLGLSQEEAAKRIRVNQFNVMNWESERTILPNWGIPGLFRFLGYDPFPVPVSVAEKLKAQRQKLGCSRKRCVKELGIDAGTLRDWEEGRTIFFRKHRLIVAEFLGLLTEDVHRNMAGRWRSSHRKTLVGTILTSRPR